MRHPSFRIALVFVATACVVEAPPVAQPPEEGVDAAVLVLDAGRRDAGPIDAGEVDEVDAGEVDAGEIEPDAGAGEVDAGEVDAGVSEVPDAGPVTTPDGPVTTRARWWKRVFVDDFRGRTGDPSDAYCFDQLKPQCTIWSGDNAACDLSEAGGEGPYPPMRENLAAALKLMDPSKPWTTLPLDQVKAGYSSLLVERWRHVNKCTWTSYQMVNWMATDYAGKWSARFDATQVSVDPSGKGYLRLDAAYAPVELDCAYGGESGGGPNCHVYGFASGELRTGVRYWVDANPQWPGVYYAQVSGQCPYGGSAFGPNCQVKSFAPHVLEETGVAYWVDADPRWPGVYYARTPYRCRDNIDYAPSLGFRRLTCPILNGGVLSNVIAGRGAPDAVTGQPGPRGRVQQHGRFEAKARVPKGVGAFPAVWLMPVAGGWPYDGGEIDVMEARDAANEVYQTYHNGKCFNPATRAQITATDDADCVRKGGQSMHLSRGYTTREKAADEFSKRDHIFAAEWDEREIRYFVNDTPTGTISLGTSAITETTSPAALATFTPETFPFRPFYWILNHSTYVPADKQAAFAKQVHQIDWVQSFERCTTQKAFCPCGGRFEEGAGCRLQAGEALACPAGVAVPQVSGGLYAAACEERHPRCPQGGVRFESQCRVHSFAANQVRLDVDYWVDADPRWPGVYYRKVNGGCPYGGSGTVNCQLVALPADALESGTYYWVDPNPGWAGVYYAPDYAP